MASLDVKIWKTIEYLRNQGECEELLELIWKPEHQEAIQEPGEPEKLYENMKNQTNEVKWGTTGARGSKGHQRKQGDHENLKY